MAKFDVIKHFDVDRSSAYDTEVRQFIPGYETMHSISHALLRHLLPTQAELLIVGAGTGQELSSYGASNAGWKFTAVDPVDTMLSMARKKINANGLSERVHFHSGFVSGLEEVAKYDASTSLLVMHFIPDDGSKAEFLFGIANRLKPGGYLIIVDLCGNKNTPEFDLLFHTWEQRQLDRASDKDEVKKRFSQIRSDISYIPEERTFQLLSDAGFSNIMNFYRVFLFCGWVARKSK